MPHSAVEAAGNLFSDTSQWKKIEIPNRKASTFRVASNGRMHIKSDRSVAFFVRKMAARKQANSGHVLERLSWRWRVLGKIPITDLANKGGDDRPVAIHLFFAKPGQRAGLFSRVFSSFPPAGHALTYVWGGKRPAESIVPNPYFKDGKILIVRSATDQGGGWKNERRDVMADLQRAFGKTTKLGQLTYIAVSGDSDDTGARTQASIDMFKLLRSGS